MEEECTDLERVGCIGRVCMIVPEAVFQKSTSVQSPRSKGKGIIVTPNVALSNLLVFFEILNFWRLFFFREAKSQCNWELLWLHLNN